VNFFVVLDVIVAEPSPLSQVMLVAFAMKILGRYSFPKLLLVGEERKLPGNLYREAWFLSDRYE
jgi:hypothetical protein